jgi:hypothetical protein
MIALNRRTKIFVSKQPTDMRSSYDSLFSRVKTRLKKDPFSGHLFLFVNKRRTSVSGPTTPLLTDVRQHDSLNHEKLSVSGVPAFVSCAGCNRGIQSKS